MKILKNISALALCLLIILAFTACGDKNTEETTAPPVKESTEKNAAASIEKETIATTKKENKIPTVKDVADANLLEKLLQRNKCVCYKIDSDYETTTEIYFTFNSEVVRLVDQTIHDTDDRFIVIEYKGMNILSVNNGDFYVRSFFDEFGTEESGNEDEPWYNNFVAYPFIDENLSFREETDEFYIFENLEDDPYDEFYIQSVCYVDKQSLNIVKTVHVNGDTVVEKEFVYNEPIELMEVLEDWNGKMRTVTVVFDTYENDKPVRYSKDYEVPYNWEVIPDNSMYDTPLFEVYLDEEYTKKYEYPGDGIDYTIYVTTLVG